MKFDTYFPKRLFYLKMREYCAGRRLSDIRFSFFSLAPALCFQRS